jgi:hypothetical protein
MNDQDVRRCDKCGRVFGFCTCPGIATTKLPQDDALSCNGDRFSVLLWRCQEPPGGLDWVHAAGTMIEARDAAQRAQGRREAAEAYCKVFCAPTNCQVRKYCKYWFILLGTGIDEKTDKGEI